MARKPARPTNPTLVALKRLLRAGTVQSQSDAARRLGVSRQRVQQLIQANGLKKPTSYGRVTFDCFECGESVTRLRSRHRALKRPDLCDPCRGKRSLATVTVSCGRCRRERRFPPSVARRLTSGLCRSCWARAIPKGRKPRPRVVVECADCGVKRAYRASLAKLLKTTLCRPCYRSQGLRSARPRKR